VTAATGPLVRVERAADRLAAGVLLVIMLIVVSDVGLRYAFNSPLSWSYDLISLYLMLAAFFPALAPTHRNDGHIAVDLFQRHIPARALRIGLALGHSAALVLFALMTWLFAGKAFAAAAAGEAMYGVFPWPTWPRYAIVCLGLALLTLRQAIVVWSNVRGALAADPVRPGRAPHGT